MTEINFYVSQQDGLSHRLEIAYRLVNLARQHDLTVHIHTDSHLSNKKMDQLLWSSVPSSFIPHRIIDPDNQQIQANEITISHNVEPMHDCDYLINLSNERPDFFSRFKKMAEIIDNSEEILSAGRKRYAFYRDRGYTLQYHKM